MIQIDGLSKTYGTRARAVTALRDVSLLMDGGVWGVVGPNGAGKTTLLGLILGFLHPSAGSITIDGLAPRRYLRRHGAAYLPERFSLPGAWPVRAALHGLARLEGHRGADAAGRVDAAMAIMGLADHADRRIGDLSRGLHQRVGLAQALLGRRRLVVLDEPTEGLDPLWRIRFRERVAELRDDHATVILASHDLAEVERLADRVIVLDDGRVTEVVETRRAPTGPLRFRLSVEAATRIVHAAFPDAEVHGTPGEADAAGAESVFVVEVADHGELSHRLAALLDSGGTVRAVLPLSHDLEARVRQRLEGP